MSGRILAPAGGPVRVDLLPDWFRNRQRGRQICVNWITAGIGLAILLGCFSLTSWLRVKREQQYRLHMAAKAEPILAAQHRSKRWAQQNERRQTWCDWVESAHPDDTLLQTLAAVAAVCQTEPGAVVLESIEIRLPTEASVAEPDAPDKPETAAGAFGRMSLIGRVESPDVALRLAERLGSQQRIEAAKVEATPTGEAASLRLSATPIAGRVLP